MHSKDCERLIIPSTSQGQYRSSCLSYLFHHSAVKEVNGFTLQILYNSAGNHFSLRPTSLHSASPSVYEHCDTLHYGSSLAINLYLSVSVELRADISQMLQFQQHFPKLAPPHYISKSKALFFHPLLSCFHSQPLYS